MGSTEKTKVRRFRMTNKLDTKMIYIGIDGGLNGGIACINESQKVQILKVMPVIKMKGKTEFDINGIVNFFKSLPKDSLVVLEKAAPRPISGKRACFMTGAGYYLIQGILSSLDISYEIVTPQRWQKELLKGLKANDTKQASIMFCQRKFPGVDLTPTERSTKAHDGLSDALCIALFSYRLNSTRLINEAANVK